MADYSEYQSVGGAYNFSKGPKSLYEGTVSSALFPDPAIGIVLNVPQTDVDDEWGGTERIAWERVTDLITTIGVSVFGAGAPNDGLVNRVNLLLGSGSTAGVFNSTATILTLGVATPTTTVTMDSSTGYVRAPYGVFSSNLNANSLTIGAMSITIGHFGYATFTLVSGLTLTASSTISITGNSAINIAASGAISIGGSSVTVSGDTSFSNNVTIAGTTTFNGGTVVTGDTTATGSLFLTGNIGLGVLSTTNDIEVSRTNAHVNLMLKTTGSYSSTLWLDSGIGGAPGIFLLSNGSSLGGIFIDSVDLRLASDTGAINFWSGGVSDRMVLTSTGNLNLKGDLYLGSTLGARLYESGGTLMTDSNFISFGIINSGGAMVVGTSLYVNTNITVAGHIDADGATSDIGVTGAAFRNLYIRNVYGETGSSLGITTIGTTNLHVSGTLRGGAAVDIGDGGSYPFKDAYFSGSVFADVVACGTNLSSTAAQIAFLTLDTAGITTILDNTCDIGSLAQRFKKIYAYNIDCGSSSGSIYATNVSSTILNVYNSGSLGTSGISTITIGSGSYASILNCYGRIYTHDSLVTTALGANYWQLGGVTAVPPAAATHYITVNINGVPYYLQARAIP